MKKTVLLFKGRWKLNPGLYFEKNHYTLKRKLTSAHLCRGILKTTNVENSVQVPSLYNKLESNDKENYSGTFLCYLLFWSRLPNIHFVAIFLGSPAFVRSPARKINSPFKKPDIKSEMKASPMRKFPALVARLGLDEDGDDSTSSIVDVNNDQVWHDG